MFNLVPNGFKSRFGHNLQTLAIAVTMAIAVTSKAPSVSGVCLASTVLLVSNNARARIHRKATLTIPASGSKDQRWVIRYKAWDIKAQKLRLIRENDFNALIEDIGQRMRYCTRRIDEINAELAAGAYYDPVAIKRQNAMEDLNTGSTVITLPAAMQLVLDEKHNLKKRSRDSLQQHLNGFVRWLDKEGLGTITPKGLTDIMAEDFLRALQKQKEVTNRTHNNYLTDLRSIFNLMKKKRYRFVTENPLDEIQQLTVDLGRNIAYSAEQEDQLMAHMRRYRPELLFLSQVMYYTFARTNEISHIQRKHIGMKAPGRIFLPRETCKTPFDRHIQIHPDLERIFCQRGIYDLDPDAYVFSYGFHPGARHYDSKYFGQRYRELVLDPLKFAPEYTFYSWRHTAVMKAKLDSRMSDGYIMMQGGWHDVKSYNNYLKSLAVFENKEFNTMFPSMGSKQAHMNIVLNEVAMNKEQQFSTGNDVRALVAQADTILGGVMRG